MSAERDESGKFVEGNTASTGRPEGAKDKKPRQKPRPTKVTNLTATDFGRVDGRTRLGRQIRERIKGWQESPYRLERLATHAAHCDLILERQAALIRKGGDGDLDTFTEALTNLLKAVDRMEKAGASEHTGGASVSDLIERGQQMLTDHPELFAVLSKIQRDANPLPEPLPTPEHQAASRPRQPVHEKPARPKPTDDTPAQEPPPDRSTGGHERGEFGFLSTPKAAWDDV